MAIALKRYKDGSYIPLLKPWSRVMRYSNSTPQEPVKEQLKKGTYKKSWFDRNIIDNLIP